MEPGSNPPQLAIGRSEQDGVQIVQLAGELDLNAVPELDAALTGASEGDHPHVCLDLSGLRFIDSTGLAAVIRGHQGTAAGGGALTIVAPCGSIVRRTLETSGLVGLLSVVEDRATALRDLA